MKTKCSTMRPWGFRLIGLYLSFICFVYLFGTNFSCLLVLFCKFDQTVWGHHRCWFVIPPPTANWLWRCSPFLHWLSSHNNNAKRDCHRLYPTAPTEHARCPPKASPMLPTEDLLLARLSSLAMAEQAFDLPTMPLDWLVFCSLPCPSKRVDRNVGVQ